MSKFSTDKDVTEDILKVFEGFRGKAYLDKTGTGTIGYGHALRPQDAELAKRTLSEPEARELLVQDIAAHKQGAIKGLKRELNQNQMAALTSLAFNEGANGKGLTKIVGMINSGASTSDIQDTFKTIVKSKGVVLDALVDRRKIEADLFATPVGQTISLEDYGRKKAQAALPVTPPVVVAQAPIEPPKSEVLASQDPLPAPTPITPPSLPPGNNLPAPSTSLISKFLAKIRSLIG